MSEWISIKDRLPEKTGYYIVAAEFDGEYPKCMIQTMHFVKVAYGTPVNMWYDYEISKQITHWMPLPEPPKK
jgi:hypothetical protein